MQKVKLSKLLDSPALQSYIFYKLGYKIVKDHDDGRFKVLTSWDITSSNWGSQRDFRVLKLYEVLRYLKVSSRLVPRWGSSYTEIVSMLTYEDIEIDLP